MDIRIHQLNTSDEPLINLIAEWYHSEWKLPVEQTREHLLTISGDSVQMQVVLFVNKTPVATGGIYHHVGLLDREPRFKIHQHWLALVYTIPEYRRQGYGAAICRHLQTKFRRGGIEKLHLFTDSAEGFYLKLGWELLERLVVSGRNLSVMQFDLASEPASP